MTMHTVATDKAPQAIGPYVQGVRAGEYVFFSGQIALDPLNGQMVGTDVRQQTDQVLRNIEALLSAVDAGVGNVVKTTVFLKNIEDFGAFNEQYAKVFGAHPPARSTVGVSALPKGALVEIECIVYLPN